MAEFLICNSNNVDRNWTSGYTAGDVIMVMPDGFLWGRRECVRTWVASGRPASEFPNDYLIIEVDMQFIKARELMRGQQIPRRVRNYNLDLSLLPGRARATMSLDSRKSMNKGGKTRHRLTLDELDVCLLPRAGKRKPSDF